MNKKQAPLNNKQETAVIGWVDWEEDGEVKRAGILVERDADGIITNVTIKEDNTEKEVGTGDGSST